MVLLLMLNSKLVKRRSVDKGKKKTGVEQRA